MLPRFLVLSAAIAAASCGHPAATSPPPVAAPAPPPAAASPADAEREASAAYDHKEYGRCGELYSALADHAASAAGQANAAYNAGCCYALDGKRDVAFGFLDRAVAHGLHDKGNIETDHDLAGIHDDPRWPTLLAAVDAQIAKFESSMTEPALRRELLAMRDVDQKARFAWIAKQDDKDLLDAMGVVDARDLARMKEIVAQVGWPGKSAVGEDGANAAWLLVQHADHDPAFQRLVLDKMQPMVPAGEVAAVDVAYLEDRVAVAEHRKQRWGTQFTEGREPQPIEDEANVDARRASIGLPSMAAYRDQMTKMYGPKK